MKRFEVQLTPQLHMGSLQHYWHIYLQDGSNKVTLQHGWTQTPTDAFVQAHKVI